MATPVDPSLYCAFSASYPEDDWISAVHIENQRAEVLLDVSWEAYAAAGYRDETARIVEAAQGDVLTISVTVSAGSSSWDQYLSWGHAIGLAELTKVADLYGGDGCPWTHTFDWTVPAADTGAYLISFWEHYGDFGAACGDHDYAERVDFTLWIEDKTYPDPDEWAWTEPAPAGVIAYPAALRVPRVLQRIYALVLSADGLPDLEVPASTILMRLRDTDASYVRATIPDPTRWTAGILARTDGQMHIYPGTIDEAGARVLDESMIYANINSVYFDVGSGNTLTLAGTRYRTTSAPASRRLDHVFRVAKDEEDHWTVEAAADPALMPGDTIVTDTGSFVADLVTVTITRDNAVMTAEGEGV